MVRMQRARWLEHEEGCVRRDGLKGRRRTAKKRRGSRKKRLEEVKKDLKEIGVGIKRKMQKIEEDGKIE